jgi:hypothetical protein
VDLGKWAFPMRTAVTFAYQQYCLAVHWNPQQGVLAGAAEIVDVDRVGQERPGHGLFGQALLQAGDAFGAFLLRYHG